MCRGAACRARLINDIFTIMRFDPDVHHRRSLRLKGWDYSRTGAYFVTICAWKKECIFIEDRIKQIVCDEWDAICLSYPEVGLDEFILMPNHLHGIIWIKNTECRGVACCALKNKAPLLGNIIRSFKSKTTVMINRYRNTIGSLIWQRNYYEHIIRNEHELNSIRLYIKENPLKWAEDEENPQNLKDE